MRKKLIWLDAAAILLLLAALVLFNLPPREAERLPDTAAESAPLGHAPGERLPDFTLTDLNGEVFSLSACRGKTVVINLWATWCAPCVKELPHFERLQRERDDVAVLALHSDLVTEDVAAYTARTEFDLRFAVDETGDIIRMLGGSTTLPQTVVVDQNGVVTYNRVGSLSYEALRELADAAR